MKVKIAAGPMEVEIDYDLEPVDPNEVIEKTMTLFKQVIEEFAALGLSMMLGEEDPEGNLYG